AAPKGLAPRQAVAPPAVPSRRPAARTRAYRLHKRPRLMIQRLVAFALRMPAIVLSVAVAIVIAGLWAYRQLDIEAYPNPVAPMTELITQPEGWSAEEVERYVTVPLETGLNGMIGLEHIRSSSLFGLSDVKCYFDWNTDYYTAQQRVLNRLGFIDLPDNAKP